MREQAIRSLVGPLVESRGLKVDRIEIMNAGKRVVLRIFLDGDGPDGRGPSLDEIAGATRAVSAALDAGNAAGSVLTRWRCPPAAPPGRSPSPGTFGATRGAL